MFETLKKNAKYSDKDLLQYVDYLAEWIEDEVSKANLQGAIIGISGGIDSAVLAIIIAKKTKIKAIGVWISIGNSEFDKKCLLLLKKNFNFNFNFLDFDFNQLFSTFIKEIKLTDELSISNLKVRLRMNAIYGLAQQNRMLVLGTTNAAEMYLGYFTKFGDGAGDLMPLAHLDKEKIKRIAFLLDIPDEIIARPPSAGLNENQTDEADLGIKYEKINDFLNFKKVDSDSSRIINDYHTRTEHKRNLPKRPKMFIEIKL